MAIILASIVLMFAGLYRITSVAIILDFRERQEAKQGYTWTYQGIMTIAAGIFLLGFR